MSNIQQDLDLITNILGDYKIDDTNDTNKINNSPTNKEILQQIPINPTKLLVDIIKNQTEKEKKNDIWSNSIYKELPKLQANNRGNVGEKLMQKICDTLNIEANIDGTKTKEIGGGIGDGKIKNKSIEIKTGTLSSTGMSFQHEMGEKPWLSNFIIFIDISPNDVYITIFKNFTEEDYKNDEFKCVPYFPTKSITRRKDIGAYKLDTSIKINELCVKNGYSIKIKENNLTDIGEFINKTIN